MTQTMAAEWGPRHRVLHVHDLVEPGYAALIGNKDILDIFNAKLHWAARPNRGVGAAIYLAERKWLCHQTYTQCRRRIRRSPLHGFAVASHQSIAQGRVVILPALLANIRIILSLMSSSRSVANTRQR